MWTPPCRFESCPDYNWVRDTQQIWHRFLNKDVADASNGFTEGVLGLIGRLPTHLLVMVDFLSGKTRRVLNRKTIDIYTKIISLVEGLIRSFVGETLSGKLLRVRGFESRLINKCPRGETGKHNRLKTCRFGLWVRLPPGILNYQTLKWQWH